MGMTMTQKILAKHAGLDSVTAGQLIEANVDLTLANDITGPVAIREMEKAGFSKVFDNTKIALVMDHFAPNKDIKSAEQCLECREFSKKYNIVNFFDVGAMGIEHALLPEKGLTAPGELIIGADSHTCTYGALGAFSTGVGSTDLAAGMATGKAWFKVPSAIKFVLKGKLSPWVSGKDVILHIIGKIGVDGALYKSMEFVGEGAHELSMDDRFTISNMAIEVGAKVGMIAPDETTFAYLKGRPFAPKGEAWDAAVEYWRTLRSDDDAVFDKEVHIDCSSLEPHVTWGTNPGQAMPVTGRVPVPAEMADPVERAGAEAALAYIGVEPGAPVTDAKVDTVFIGSCTNGRLEDFREAARVLKDRRVADGVRALAVPGSMAVRAAAEAEGLDRIFIEAGFEWRLPGCSMCLAMNDDRASEGSRVASTSNRNFVGRQGRGSRTHLMSPASAAAAAVAGHIADVRDYI